jgi:hypothetical protein
MPLLGRHADPVAVPGVAPDKAALAPGFGSYAGAYANFRPESEQNCSHTPPGVGMARKPPLWVKPSDVVEVEISRIGVLSSSVVAEAT